MYILQDMLSSLLNTTNWWVTCAMCLSFILLSSLCSCARIATAEVTSLCLSIKHEKKKRFFYSFHSQFVFIWYQAARVADLTIGLHCLFYTYGEMLVQIPKGYNCRELYCSLVCCCLFFLWKWFSDQKMMISYINPSNTKGLCISSRYKCHLSSTTWSKIWRSWFPYMKLIRLNHWNAWIKD